MTAPTPERSPTDELQLIIAHQQPEPAKHPLLRPFHAIDRLLGLFEQVLLTALLATMIGLGTIDIVLQNADRLHLPVPDSIRGGFMWADPVLRWLVLWVGMVGAMLATRSGRHLNMDALARLLPTGIRRWVDVVVNLTAGACCGVLLYVSFPYLQEEIEGGGEAIVGPIQRWHAEIIFPVMFAVMTYRFLLAAADGVLGGRPGSLQAHMTSHDAAEGQIAS